jgi:WD40-like Beta Propeller Repeat
MPRWVAAVLVALAVGMALAELSAASSSSFNRDLPVWSPGGRYLAYVVRFGPQSRQYGRVMLVSSVGSAPRVLAQPRLLAQFGRSVYVSELRFAGSARLVVALGGQGALCSIDIRTRKVIPLGPPVGGVNNGTCNDRDGPLSLGANDTFTVSADGRRVAYVTDSPYENQNSAQAFGGDFAIGLVSSLGGPWRTLPEPINASDEWPSFSPDGSQLVFARSLLAYRTASAPSLMLQSVKGGQARPLHIQGAHPVWSPNGHWIAYQQLAYGPAALLPAALAIVNPDGGNSRTI